ncbi:hypothetical protein [Amycolatopsis sulphurea]|uniref:hypothetical protein n=1 Tax=Amycolatopsis sulphurea TaxID=76022 RepID=UPI002695703A
MTGPRFPARLDGSERTDLLLSTLVAVGAAYRRVAGFSGRPPVHAVDRRLQLVVDAVRAEADDVVSLRTAMRCRSGAPAHTST